MRYPPSSVLSSTQAHLCNTPCCNVSRDNCAIPHENGGVAKRMVFQKGGFGECALVPVFRSGGTCERTLVVLPGNIRMSETGRIRFRRVRFQTPNSVSFLPSPSSGRELSEFLSAYYLCAKANSSSLSKRTHRVCPKPQ